MLSASRFAVPTCLSLILMLVGGCADPDAADTEAPTDGAQTAETPTVEFGMVVHGGAGVTRAGMPAEREERTLAGMRAALEAGHAVLAAGGSSLDAVEAAINVMEDDSVFNSGRGAVFTHDGRNALDASIMDGSTLGAGAVAGVEDVRNPISLARLVMTESPHVLLSRRGAEEFAREQGIPSTPPDYFRTERRWQSLQEALEAEASGGMGTVGAIALDQDGNLAAGTSTGGMTNKRWDRIGDSPIIGAGTYADGSCGISSTGWGEYFIRNVVAHDICARMAYKGISLAAAADEVILGILEQQEEDTGGIIGMDARGNIVMPFNTEGMNRGWVDQDGNVTVAVFER